jgi:D-arginine dehydrogenase
MSGRAGKQRDPTASVAVIGAGILGCLTAHEIAVRWPQAAIVVLDRDAIGSGASRRSAGLHLPIGRTDLVRQMAAYSQDYYEALQRSDPSLPIYALPATAVVGPAGVQRLHETYLKEANLTRVIDLPAHVVLPHVVLPQALPEGTEIFNIERCHYADVFTLVHAMARRLRPRVSFCEGLRVAGIEPSGDGVSLRLSTGESLQLDRVVLAPGPWVGEPAWRALLAPLGLRVKKIVALHVEQVPAAHAGAVIFPDDDAFLLPLQHRGHWLFSYTCQQWDVDPDGLDGLDADTMAEATGALRRYAPNLLEHASSGRVFCDAYSADRQPRVQTVDDDGRVVFAGAANGSGYRLAPAIARQAADLLAHPLQRRRQ